MSQNIFIEKVIAVYKIKNSTKEITLLKTAYVGMCILVKN